MKNVVILFAILAGSLFLQGSSPAGSGGSMSSISQAVIDKAIGQLRQQYGEKAFFRIEKGVKQAASLWQSKDGTEEQFLAFCTGNFIANDQKLDEAFGKLQTNFEILYGHLNKISLDLKRPLHLEMGEVTPLDETFGGYDPGSHLTEDLFDNKVAFMVLLNFPTYSLAEKTANAATWSRKQWAYARVGDLFTSRIPAAIIQKFSQVYTEADSYISEYNIFMGNLVDAKGKTLFPQDLKLITHWGLRDELKSNYATGALDKQRMIYEVMKRIISQDIPGKVINNPSLKWNPFTNKVLVNGVETTEAAEPDTRYHHLLENFKALKAMDPYCPVYPDYISRKFDAEMEISQADVEKLFREFCSAPEIKQTAQLISKRLGRKLEPFDIWYDGFKSRSSISEEQLTSQTRAKYPNREAFEADLPGILQKLGFSPSKAGYLTSKITVDGSRGAGHAWGAQMKGDLAHLRTRIGKAGMDYKGYNIAVHEFGHNVEQTLSLYDVDFYMLQGVPNTAFTEALAFSFQKRDLELLGVQDANPDKLRLQALDNLWASFEIMGVSLVDMSVWKWLYAHPDATPAQLKQQVVASALEVWNQYFAPVFGIKDQPILAIYSHMIDNPLYLSAYPIGHLIEFQLDRHMEGKNFAGEVERIYTQGRLIPQVWMRQAVGREIANEPSLEAAREALKVIKK